MEKHYGDKNITTHRKERLKLSNGPYQDKVETVVAAVRTARMRIPAVGAEHQLPHGQEVGQETEQSA